MISARLIPVCFFALFLSGILLGQSTVAIFEFEDIGAGTQTTRAASQVFRSEIKETGKFEVLSGSDIESGLTEQGIYSPECFNLNCAINYGRQLGADLAIIGSLTQLGNRIIAEAQLIDVASGKSEFSDNFSSDNIDDLNSVVARLAAAIADRKKVNTNANVFDLTEEETQQQRHRKSYVTNGASFGFGFPLGDKSYSGVKTLKALSWCMRYEAGKFVVDNSLGVCWGSVKLTQSVGGEDRKGVFIIPWDIGMKYILSQKSDLSPFIGAGFGFHFIFSAKVNDEPIVKSDQAPAVYLSTGLYAFQSYDFRLIIDVKYTTVFTEAFIGSDGTSSKTSQKIGISVGISRAWESGQKKFLFIF